MPLDDLDDKWSAPQREIMNATYRTLLEYGYAGLSISRIGSEYKKSKSLIYHHYESKEDLLVAFLEFVIDRFEATITAGDRDDPGEHLKCIINRLLLHQPAADQWQIQKVLVTLRSQAVTSDSFREQFTRVDDRIVSVFSDIIERGITVEEFTDVDSSAVAEHILATINGAIYSDETTNRKQIQTVRTSLLAYLNTILY